MIGGDRIRVLQVIGNLDRGGGQEVVRTLVRQLPDLGVDPVVATLRDGPLRSEIEADGVPVEVVPGRRLPITAGPAAVRDLRRIRRDLAAVAARHRTSVVQTHLLRSLDFLVLTLRGRGGIETVYWTIHNAELELRADQLPPSQAWLLGPKRLLHQAMYRAGGRRVDGFVAVSADVGDSIRRVYRPRPGRLAVIPNGVDVDRYGGAVDRRALRRAIGVPEDARVAIVVAKLMRQKGHAVFLESLALMAKSTLGASLHAVLVGEGELRAELEARVSSLGLEERVHFLGSRRDIPELLAASDLFILPSLWEGLPMALLEAMASGLPLVATAVSGTREVVDSGEHGILVPAGNARALADGIEQLIGDPVAAAAMGVAARRRVEDCYSARAQAARHAELYRAGLASIQGKHS